MFDCENVGKAPKLRVKCRFIPTMLYDFFSNVKWSIRILIINRFYSKQKLIFIEIVIKAACD